MLHRIRYNGRLIGVIAEDPLLIHYGDLVHSLPSSFGDLVPMIQKVNRHQQIFVRAPELHRLAHSDKITLRCRMRLIDLLINLEEEIQNDRIHRLA